MKLQINDADGLGLIGLTAPLAGAELDTLMLGDKDVGPNISEDDIAIKLTFSPVKVDIAYGTRASITDVRGDVISLLRPGPYKDYIKGFRFASPSGEDLYASLDPKVERNKHYLVFKLDHGSAR